MTANTKESVTHAGAPVVMARVQPDGDRRWRAIVRFDVLAGGDEQVFDVVARVIAGRSEVRNGMAYAHDLDGRPALPARLWLAMDGADLCVMAASVGPADLRCRLESFGPMPTDLADPEQPPALR